MTEAREEDANTPEAGDAPRFLTGEQALAIISAVEAGNTVTTAVAAAGVDPAGLYKWASSAGDSDPEFRAFTAALGEARAKAERDMVAAVVADAKGGVLVRRYVKTFPNGTEETDETFSPPNGRIALEWLRTRNGLQWGKPEMVSDMLGGDAAAAGQAGPGVQPGTIEALAGRLHSLLSSRAEEDATEGGHPDAVAGAVVEQGT